jgi:hypothetical protein
MILPYNLRLQCLYGSRDDRVDPTTGISKAVAKIKMHFFFMSRTRRLEKQREDFGGKCWNSRDHLEI